MGANKADTKKIKKLTASRTKVYKNICREFNPPKLDRLELARAINTVIKLGKFGDSEMLGMCLHWDSSPQGHEYWSELDRKYGNKLGFIGCTR